MTRQVQDEHAPARPRTERVRATLVPVLRAGPDFLAGSLHADDMTDTMITAARTYRDEGLALTGIGAAGATPEDRELDAVMKELYVCGSGYQAGRCEADCVARTMTAVMGQFGDLAADA